MYKEITPFLKKEGEFDYFTCGCQQENLVWLYPVFLTARFFNDQNIIGASHCKIIKIVIFTITLIFVPDSRRQILILLLAETLQENEYGKSCSKNKEADMVRKYDYYKIGHNYEILKGKRVIIWCRSITALDRIAYNNGMGEGLTIISKEDFVFCARKLSIASRI